MRPTGRLHIGHLVGALDNWFKAQSEYDCYFMVADWHALTTAHSHSCDIPANIIEMATSWRALGIDFAKSVVFVQSDVPEHAELHLLLSMVTPMSWVERDPTLKSMFDDYGLKSVSYGLMGYPVLQAADILLYKAGAVPVGADQVPHVELAREIARAFNRTFGQVFPEPEPLLTVTPRLPGLDGRKMSKGLDNCIYLDDEPDAILSKVTRLFTDPAKLHATDPGDPEKCHVQEYHKAFRPEDAEGHAADCRAGRLGCVAHKEYLAKVLDERLAVFREDKRILDGRKDDTACMLRQGASRASIISEMTIQDAKRAACIGRYPRCR